MFEHQRRLYSILLMASDVVVGLPAIWLAYYLRSHPQFWLWPGAQDLFFRELLALSDYVLYWLAFVPLTAFLLHVTQDYGEIVRRPLLRQYTRAFRFIVAAAFWSGAFLFFLQLEVSRPIWLIYIALNGILLLLNRLILHWVFRSRNINEHNQIKILIVGTDSRARRVGRILGNLKKWGYEVVGYVARGDELRPSKSLRVLGKLSDLPDLLDENLVVDEVIFAGSQRQDPGAFETTIQYCEALGVRTRIAADFFPTSTAKVSLEYLENLPLITFSTVPEHRLSLTAKRFSDFAVAVSMLTLLSPLMLAAAILIKMTSGGPVLYRQTRCGLFGRRFTLVKFRTMHQGAEDRLWEIRHLNEMDGPVFKMRQDPRVTRLGRFLRLSSIDELPQLWNVIKGEMSLVGPRAPLPEEVKHYALKQRRRLSVKPGITCLWQVSGRNDVDFQKWMELDLEYIDNWSFWLDLRILLRTIPAVFTARGAR